MTNNDGSDSMRRRLVTWCWFAGLVVLCALPGCSVVSPSHREADASASSEGPYRGVSDVVPPSELAGESKSATRRTSPDPAQPAADRKMIYTASLSVEVARPEESIERYLARVIELGGYLSQRQNNTITCRVPADRFEELVAEIRTYGRVLQDSQQARDVTKQHLDLSIRLENARKSRDRLLALLEKAEKVEDILKIEEQLRRLTTEIERIEGELKYLDDQVAMSTVAVTFVPVQARPSPKRRPSMFPWLDRIGVENVLRHF